MPALRTHFALALALVAAAVLAGCTRPAPQESARPAGVPSFAAERNDAWRATDDGVAGELKVVVLTVTPNGTAIHWHDITLNMTGGALAPRSAFLIGANGTRGWTADALPLDNGTLTLELHYRAQNATGEPRSASYVDAGRTIVIALPPARR